MPASKCRVIYSTTRRHLELRRIASWSLWRMSPVRRSSWHWSTVPVSNLDLKGFSMVFCFAKERMPMWNSRIVLSPCVSKTKTENSCGNLGSASLHRKYLMDLNGRKAPQLEVENCRKKSKMFLINASMEMNNKEWKDMTTQWLNLSSMQTQSFTIGPGSRKPTLPRSLGMCVSNRFNVLKQSRLITERPKRAQVPSGAVVRFPIPAMLWLKKKLPPWHEVGSPYFAAGVSLSFCLTCLCLLGSASNYPLLSESLCRG